MQIITHQEARHLIQHSADRALEVQDQEVLSAHLQNCTDCADYASEIHEAETVLRTTLRKHWNAHARPLPIRDIKAKSIYHNRWLDSLATRSALVGVTLLVFIFVYWQLASPGYGTYRPVPVGIPPIPTPSLPLTSTQNSFENCQMIRYEVHQGDTLESLTHQFFVSEEQIMDLNGLKAETVPLPKILTIPLCEMTPTSTTHPPTSTTNTPSLESTTYTPG